MTGVPNVDVRITDVGRTIGGTWTPSDAERAAAWEVVVELVTRVPIIPLREDDGRLDEALESLWDLSTQVRTILRRHGPALAVHRPGELSFAVLAGVMVNEVLRPPLAYWHARLDQQLEAVHDPPVGRYDLERAWEERPALVEALARLREPLVQFARCFAEASGSSEFLRVQLDSADRDYDRARRRAANDW
jgi:hypothetical protein